MSGPHLTKTINVGLHICVQKLAERVLGWKARA